MAEGSSGQGAAGGLWMAYPPGPRPPLCTGRRSWEPRHVDASPAYPAGQLIDDPTQQTIGWSKSWRVTDERPKVWVSLSVFRASSSCRRRTCPAPVTRPEPGRAPTSSTPTASESSQR